MVRYPPHFEVVAGRLVIDRSRRPPKRGGAISMAKTGAGQMPENNSGSWPQGKGHLANCQEKRGGSSRNRVPTGLLYSAGFAPWRLCEKLSGNFSQRRQGAK